VEAHALWDPVSPRDIPARIHQLIEGMSHVEVVADAFVVVGYGETQEQAMRDHDKNLMAFLQLCSVGLIK